MLSSQPPVDPIHRCLKSAFRAQPAPTPGLIPPPQLCFRHDIVPADRSFACVPTTPAAHSASHPPRSLSSTITVMLLPVRPSCAHSASSASTGSSRTLRPGYALSASARSPGRPTSGSCAPDGTQYAREPRRRPANIGYSSLISASRACPVRSRAPHRIISLSTSQPTRLAISIT